jgi:hypothetical protein
MENAGNAKFKELLKQHGIETPDYRSEIMAKYRRELEEKANNNFGIGVINEVVQAEKPKETKEEIKEQNAEEQKTKNETKIKEA